MASYKVLARKWRPRTFEDLVGQEFPALTLKNSIESGKTAHALLFSGPRGTGKTSTARIVAKAINCEKKDGEQSPCTDDPCPRCEEISEGKSIDVQEIDAASHTGVADVREIIESAKYMPASAKKKVYIIDETHMLSQSAFNALLKIMEEPPEHAVFILATTEAHKVPATIMSRCQQYDFKKIPVEKIKNSLEKITKAEKIKIDSETLYLIAREADGSMRDSLSLLDQLSASFDAEIKHDDVIRLLGIPDKESLKDLLRAVFEKDAAKCVDIVRESAARGTSPRRMAHDVIHMFKNLLYLKICGGNFRSELSDDDKKELSGMVKNETAETVELLFDIMLEAGEKIRTSSYPEIVLEFALVKMSTVGKVEKIEDMIKRLEKLSGGTSRAGNGSPKTQAREKREKKPSRPEREKEAPAAPVARPRNLGKKEVVELLNKEGSFLARRLEKAHSLEVNGETVRITFLKNGTNYQNDSKKPDNELKDVLKKVLALKNVILDIETIDDENPGGEKVSSRAKRKPAEDPVVDYAIREFEASVIERKNTAKG